MNRFRLKKAWRKFWQLVVRALEFRLGDWIREQAYGDANRYVDFDGSERHNDS